MNTSVIPRDVHRSNIEVFQSNLKIEGSDCCRKICLTAFQLISRGIGVGVSFWTFSWSIGRKSEFSDRIWGRRLRLLPENFSDRTSTDFCWSGAKSPNSAVVFTPTYTFPFRGCSATENEGGLQEFFTIYMWL